MSHYDTIMGTVVDLGEAVERANQIKLAFNAYLVGEMLVLAHLLPFVSGLDPILGGEENHTKIWGRRAWTLLFIQDNAVRMSTILARPPNSSSRSSPNGRRS